MPEFTIESLRAEYLVDPVGIDEKAPRLSWRLASDRRGSRQIFYRIRVSSTSSKLSSGEADLWDSGRVESGQTTQIAYEGLPLESRARCHWNVTVWDELGGRMQSEPAFWSMGLLASEDWQAHWIACDPQAIQRDADAIEPSLKECGTPALFRKEFALEETPTRATLYVTARGVVEAEVCGKRVSEDLFAPEWTDYDKRIHYRAYDVSELIEGAEGSIGLTLGDGWWSGYVGWQETRARYGDLQNSVCAQLEIEFADGRRETIVTDAAWRCNTGPILFSDFMMGETYDARREREGWSASGFDASDWLSAIEVDAPSAPLCAQRSEPVRVIETIDPLSRVEIEPGVFVFDLGQNISGWARLQVSQPAGARVQIRFAEKLNPDGTLYTENLRLAKSTDVYICKGSGVEVWEPRFTFHGFQYIEVSGLETAESANCVVGQVIHSATPPAGTFECSNADVNRLWLNGLWSQKDNFLSVPTDCPQRDERLGWMGDAQIFLRTATYNMDVAGFFTKWMIDVRDAQTQEGIFPDTAPRLREGDNFIGLDDLVGGAAWADAGIIIPHTIWRVYSDTRMMETHWKAMSAWMDYLERTNPDYLRVNDLRNNYGDWLCIPSDREFRTHSPMKDLLATAYWADDAAKMAQMARELGKEEEAVAFEATFDKVKAAFQAKFVNENGSLTVDTQTAYLLALGMNLMPTELRDQAAAHLVENIKQLDWHLSTGFVGIRFLNPILTEAGHADVAYKLLLQDTYPSWLYPVKHGATTIWERWNGWTEEEGFFEPTMNSFNHYSLGSVGEWLFSHVAGIELDESIAGFAKGKLKPYPSGELDYAKASYLSAHGRYRSSWRKTESDWLWEFEIPTNATATVWIPSGAISAITIDGLPVEACKGIELFETQDKWTICNAVAGSYVVKVAGGV